jgi:rubrerythrin
MSAEHRHDPRNGAARALLDADPDTDVSEIPELLADVERWVCVDCGAARYTNPITCGECGAANFEKVCGVAGD